MADEQLQPQPEVPSRSPVPTHFTFGTVTGGRGERLVIMLITTPVGENTYFLPAETARECAQFLLQQAELADVAVPGLVIPHIQVPA